LQKPGRFSEISDADNRASRQEMIIVVKMYKTLPMSVRVPGCQKLQMTA